MPGNYQWSCQARSKEEDEINGQLVAIVDAER